VPFVYTLRCRDGSFYTGAANNLVARLREYEEGRASRYTPGSPAREARLVAP